MVSVTSLTGTSTGSTPRLSGISSIGLIDSLTGLVLRLTCH
jgi:hypothetical protein